MGTDSFGTLSAAYLDEADGFLIYANSGGTPSQVVLNLLSGLFTSSTKNLSLLTSAFNRADTIRARYVVWIGNPALASVTNKFTVLQNGAALFTSPQVQKVGDTTTLGITFLAISNSGKFIFIQFFDNTDGLTHIQLWQGS